MPPTLRWVLVLAGALALAGAGYWGWETRRGDAVPEGFVMANGRIEATEVDIATILAGRIEGVLVEEGDQVRAGQTLARMDKRALEAELRRARAEVVRAREMRKVATAVSNQRDSECALTGKELERSLELFRKGYATEERVDRDLAANLTAEAACAAARARVVEAGAAIEVADAQVARLVVDLEDHELTAPVAGQVLYRLAEPGEVLPAGGKILTIVDLDDVHMSVFLPTDEAGRLLVGGEARIVADALPDRPVAGTVSFVSPEAQFTPKEVETATERQKLMFRVKIRADGNADRLLKPGMRGIVLIRLDPAAPWPDAPQ